jgi:septum site-determining protein MinC
MEENRTLPISIKGIRDGLLVTFSEGDWEENQTALYQQIQEKETFFKGAKITLDVGTTTLHAAELGALRDKLSDLGVSLRAVLGSSPVTTQNAQVLGLATRVSAPRPERTIKSLDTNIPGENAVLVHRTLRSGFRVAYNGHVVVFGDVNPGAEISASGCIIVWGNLRGSALAGVEGDESAVICALNLEPTQVRIADLVYSPVKRKHKTQPEMARVENGQVVIDTWKTKE